MGTTARGFPYPESSDKVSDGHQAIEDLAEAVDDEFDGLSGIYLAKALADAAGDLLVADGADSFARLAKGADGDVLGVDDGTVGWVTPPAGAQVAAGSFVGDGTTDRTIALPFDPVWVAVYHRTTDRLWFSNIGGGTRGVRLTTGLDWATANDGRPALTSGGFIVSGSSTLNTNFSGVTFDYVAIG